jgi:hypothetical protein
MIRAALVFLAIVASPAMAEDCSLAQHTDREGNYVCIGLDFCARGPAVLHLPAYGIDKTVAAGQFWPPGCAFGKTRRRR